MGDKIMEKSITDWKLPEKKTKGEHRNRSMNDVFDDNHKNYKLDEKCKT